MPDSNTETQFAPDADRSQELRRPTEGWLAPGAPISADLLGATLPAVSTPGPNDPERITHPESTENMVAPRAASLPPIPGYVIEKLIGRGGMGVVYRATHTATGRLVALKLTNPGNNDDVTRDRFVREVHTLASIKHPNIVPVYDAGDWHGFPYCTMEFVPGGTLSEHLNRIRTDLRAAVRLMVKVARAVEALHAVRIFHRDLKPLNILLGSGNEPMVADFGLAKCIDDDSDLTYTGLPVGTRQYMSPEQTLGKKGNLTAGCDVWALGVTLYELLTGQRPFIDDGITDVYHSIRTAEPQPITTLSPDVPVALQAIVWKCLAKKPENRYSTAAALADDLDCWLGGKPISVPVPAPSPPTTVVLPEPERNKYPRRDRVVLMSCSAVALVAFAALFSNPTKLENPPKTFAERVAGGEKVRLTDEKGKLLVQPTHEPGHELHPDTIDGYHSFTNSQVGITSLANEPLSFPYKVEAKVGVAFQTTLQEICAGIYAGRRTWDGLPFKHESLIWAGPSPRTALPNPPGSGPAKQILQSQCGLYWWQDNENGSPVTVEKREAPWDPEGEKLLVQFVRVVMEVRPDAVDTWIDGVRLNRLTDNRQGIETGTIARLNRLGATKLPPAFRDYKFTSPTLGSGIGIFCQGGQCIVRDLTVSKLDP
ncbi:Serine/threonine-protein kinase PknB [Gemmata sp. SH-PL17]|uniref:serine/threonine protein kinase n=1 Tax=Gemmata sp. SH-PL17 TaxID=1630693 RepID=UPI00078EEEF3|nr:serine/threonine-protein kinase [Gemmata sp. SH-PL17]AMV26495.1 Serine/threonine-protein kinase PknB [Gemmata sp. SH-PL17]